MNARLTLFALPTAFFLAFSAIAMPAEVTEHYRAVFGLNKDQYFERHLLSHTNMKNDVLAKLQEAIASDSQQLELIELTEHVLRIRLFWNQLGSQDRAFDQTVVRQPPGSPNLN